MPHNGRIRSANKAIVTNAESVIHRLETGGVLIGEFFGGFPLFLSGGLHLLPVFVGARHKAHVKTVESLKRASTSAAMVS